MISLDNPPPSAGSAPPARVFGEIPAWTLSGVLPPYLGDPRFSVNMAPYATTLQNIVERFAFSPKRIEILEGFLAYRRALANLNITDGFQWINGSLTEDIEKIESRDPNDIDVVTFFRRPVGAKDPIAWAQFFSINQQLFSSIANKSIFKCDTQYIDLDSSSEDVVSLTRFWFGLFSHRRNDIWKGMLTIPLATSADDDLAQQQLAAKHAPATIPPVGSNP
jgi:hypothetical protein